MKLTRINSLIRYWILAICIVANSAITAEESARFTEQALQIEEINERMNLYKRIKLEQNKKALMQLLHDIADIQKQCRDKGYLCSVEGSDTFNLSFPDLNPATTQANNRLPPPRPERIVAPDLNLLGIVGGRARFRLKDGRIEDFSLGALVADLWEVAEINPETALLVYETRPEIKMYYRIHKGIIPKPTHLEDVAEDIP